MVVEENLFLLKKMVKLVDKEYLKEKHSIVSNGEKRSLRKITEARALFVGLAYLFLSKKYSTNNIKEPSITPQLVFILKLTYNTDIYFLNKKFKDLLTTEIFFRAFYEKLKGTIVTYTETLFTEGEKHIEKLFTEKEKLLKELQNINNKLKTIWLEDGMQIENLL